MVFLELCVGIPLLVGGIQDLKTREVSDLVWLPLLLIMAYDCFSNPSALLGLSIALPCYYAVKKKLMGLADLFAFTALALAPNSWGISILLSFMFFSMSCLVHMILKGRKARTFGYPLVFHCCVGFLGSIAFVGYLDSMIL